MVNLSDLIINPIETISLTAIVETGMCVGAGGSSGSLADKPVVRTAQGKLLIPASQIKGRLRHECEKLARGLGWAICQSPVAKTMCPQREGLTGNFARENYYLNNNYHCLVCQIFGNPALPSRVLFDDLICDESPENLEEVLRPGVTINRRRRIAEAEKLYYLETTPTNIDLKFSGAIHFLPNCPDYAKALIVAGLHHIHALGGSKSAGLGWLRWDLDDFPTIKENTWSKLLSDNEVANN